jgi:hypothetical protein
MEDATNPLGGLARLALQRAYLQRQVLDENMLLCHLGLAEHAKISEQVRRASALSRILSRQGQRRRYHSG